MFFSWKQKLCGLLLSPYRNDTHDQRLFFSPTSVNYFSPAAFALSAFATASTRFFPAKATLPNGDAFFAPASLNFSRILCARAAASAGAT
jgi:hypothetical protein